ncbi:MAG: PD-(D/E)XK nuclease family protein [Planctomycetes bacterium]|nr:PD-(D/E)XK nuclease family protein [Planctomycetota bacterium]
MPVTLITGPHQSGKSRRLWERLRAEPVGTAVLVRPTAGLPHDLIRQVHAWSGPGLLPPVWSFGDLVERCAAVESVPRALSGGLSTHVLRAWAPHRLRGPWAALARFRATGRELAELVRRLDDHAITEADIVLAQRSLRERGESALADNLGEALAARAHIVDLARKQGAMLPGARLRLLTEAGAAPSIATIAIDDFQTFTPAELGFLRSLGERRQVYIVAIDDARLGRDAALADRLRAALPGASEERLTAIAVASPHAAGVRALLGGVLEEGRPVVADGVDRYRYRDPLHAGRAIAAWLRRSGTAPAQAMLVVRVADGEALALADALAAAEVPVSGRFQVPFLGTSAGGAFAALAAFCREQTWTSFLAVAERLAGDAPPPVRLVDLTGPWARLGVDEAMGRIDTLAQSKKGECDGWGWNEPGKGNPWLTAGVAWLKTWRERLRADGTWWDRLVKLTKQLDLSDGGSGVLRTLAELAELHPLSPEDLDELLGAARVTVERDGGTGALEITDAVRGRTWPRPVVFIHDLEHGRWPALPSNGALLPGDERRHLASVLARDIYDEAGRAAGELGAFLAVIGRATQRVVFGIPCGEREPCAWLGTICDQLGWDLEKLREDAGAEAVPGAPLGPHDAQGAHECALWSVAPGTPSFTFRVPPTTDLTHLGLKVSALGTLFRDAFAVVCDRLCLSEPLVDQEVMDEGSDLHVLLAKLAPLPPATWAQELARLLPEWIAKAPDALKRVERARRARNVVEVIASEAIPASDATQRKAEVKRTVPLDVPGHDPLVLTGYIDRVDHLADGRVRLIDYKRGALSNQMQALKDGSDGQLLGYLLAARAAGWPADGAYYLSLRDGARAGWGTIPTPAGRQASKVGVALTELDRLAVELGNAIALLAAGAAAADPEGRSARDYAAIARVDERRLDVGGEAHG